VIPCPVLAPFGLVSEERFVATGVKVFPPSVETSANA